MTFEIAMSAVMEKNGIACIKNSVPVGVEENLSLKTKSFSNVIAANDNGNSIFDVVNTNSEKTVNISQKMESTKGEIQSEVVVKTENIIDVKVEQEIKIENDIKDDFNAKIDNRRELNEEKVKKPVKKSAKKKKTSNQLAKLLEDSTWYMELSNSNKTRQSSLKIEKIKEEKLAKLIYDNTNENIEESTENNELTPGEVAEKERRLAQKRERAKLMSQKRKLKQEQKSLKRKQCNAERKRLIAEGNYVPKSESKKKTYNPKLDLDNIDSTSYYAGNGITQLLKASLYYTNQGKLFDGSKREVKPVERLTDDKEYLNSFQRRTQGKKLKQPRSNTGDYSDDSTEEDEEQEEDTYNHVDESHSQKAKPKARKPGKKKKQAKKPEPEPEQKPEPAPEQKSEPAPEPEPEVEPEEIWFTKVTDDNVDISSEWKFFQNFIYENKNDNILPIDIVQAADIIRNKIKIYRTDHEVYKLQRVSLHFPFSEYQENYLLALPKDDVQFNPFDEIGKLMELMAILFFPEEDKIKVMNLEESENCIVGRYIKAFETNDIDNLLNSIGEFNDLIDILRNNGKILEYTRKRNTFPRHAIYELLNQCYSRCVLPESRKLSNYKAFSNEVYGELMPSFLTTVYKKCDLNHKSCFIDLGSGVGNCVIQAALEFGCESHGVEIVENASRLGDLQLEEFKSRCKIFGLNPGFVNLFSKQSFVDNLPVKNIIDKCDVILVNNYLFDNALNKKVIELFQDLKVGTKIISLKPIVPATHKINWDNCSSILNRLKTSKFIYVENSVSWTSKGGFYYITEVMNEILEDNFVVFKSRESRRRDEGLDTRSRSDTPLNAFTNNV
jgi:H3 lysine-79-specific histone-lysine N-methyltransferase